MSSKDAIQKIFERKMSDAKDLLDSLLYEKLSDSLNSLHEAKLDPVGKEDGDIDNDGDEDDTDSYLANRRKAIGKAIKQKSMKEGKEEEEKEDTKKLDSRGLGVTRQSGLGKPTKDKTGKSSPKVSVLPIKKMDEGAPEAPHDSAFVHDETEAREKKVKKTVMRAKPSRGGSY
tara:strand:+ start:1127 stop:1645 length:519 start_codon:yes stop_codon:yes gene_type:complete